MVFPQKIHVPGVTIITHKLGPLGPYTAPQGLTVTTLNPFPYNSVFYTIHRVGGKRNSNLDDHGLITF